MKNLEFINICLSSDVDELVRTALEITGKINITKENPVMKIKVKGNLILDFSGKSLNQTLELYSDE